MGAPSPPELDDAQRKAARRIVVAQTAGKLGDVLANAKTVLTWLMVSVGAPAALVGVLVPIRESGSMLPQLWLTGVVQRFSRRKWAYLAGALGQAIACAAIAVAAMVLSGVAAGVAIVVALAFLSLTRALCSIAGKDVLGRTVPKGARGRVGGRAASLSGLLGALGSVAAMVGMRGDGRTGLYAAVVVAGALAFALAGVAYASVDEPATDPEQTDDRPRARLSLLWEDPALRRFVLARALLLGSALGGPLFVLFGQQASDRLSSLAAFVLASGAATALSSNAWGRLSDRSGDRAMAWGGVIACGAGSVAIALRLLVDLGTAATVVWPLLYFAFTVGYSGVRVGRKTYVVDMAGGDRRTAYVATSNTAIALVLLGFGAIGAAIQTWSEVAALGLFVAITAAGSAMSLRLSRE
ncbi:MAG: MFS transporter [Nannocystaceae bacterium]